MAYNFKNEEDVKEYLKNIHIEYRFGCEKENNGNACHLLGDYTESIIVDLEKAGNIYKSNCDERNWPRSCTKFGNFRYAGRGCESDEKEAYKYMKKGCEFGDTLGCRNAGNLAITSEELYESDRTVQISNGMKMLQKSCDQDNDKDSCFYLSTVFLGAVENEVKVNYDEAHKLSLKACDLGHVAACANISQMYARGQGVVKNPALAKAFKHRAITLHQQMTQPQTEIKFGRGIRQ